MSTEKQYVEECIKIQEDYCKKNNVPNFVPRDGICWSCNRTIFGTERYQYTKEKAATTLITACPFCCRTYCD